MLLEVSRRFAAFTLVAAAVTLVASTPAHAVQSVTYSTTGAFNGFPASPGASPVSTTPGDITLTFTGTNGSVNLFIPPSNSASSNAQFGTFTASAGSGPFNYSELNGQTFTLYITQTLPVPTTGSPATYNATLSGVIFATQSEAYLEFQNPLAQVITSGDLPTYLTYSVNSRIDLVPSSTPGGATLSGRISAVPEPTTLAAAFAGLPLIGFAAWRRNRRKQA